MLYMQYAMKNSSSSKVSKTDRPRVRALKDNAVKTSAEHPEANVKHIVRGIVRQGLKPASPEASMTGSRPRQPHFRSL